MRAGLMDTNSAHSRTAVTSVLDDVTNRTSGSRGQKRALQFINNSALAHIDSRRWACSMNLQTVWFAV
jgi:tRNA(Phe) wybutosine-synthesizing methylase Tyw3